MKTNQLPTALALAAAILFGAMTCAAQNNTPYQQYALPQELATYLSTPPAQIDQLNILGYGPMNYYWNEFGSQIADLQEQMQELVNNFTASQSPQSIGVQVGNLTTQELTIFQQLMAQIKTSNATLLRLLTPTQQAKLAALQSAMSNAQQTMNLVSDAYYGGFFLNPIYPNQFSGMGGGYTTTPTAMAMVNTDESVIRKAMNETVARIRAERATAKAETDRKARFAGQVQVQ